MNMCHDVVPNTPHHEPNHETEDPTEAAAPADLRERGTRGAGLVARVGAEGETGVVLG